MSLLNKYYDLKTVQKIGLLSGVMSLFIVIVGLTGFYFNCQNENNVISLYQNRAVPMSKLNLARSTANRIRTDVIEYIFADSSARRKELLTDISDMRDRNNKIIKEYESTKLDKFEVDTLVTMHKNLDAWRDMQDVIIKKTDNGDKIGAYHYYLENSKVPEKFQQSLRDLAEYNTDVAKQLYVQTKNNVFNANIIIITNILVAIIIGALFGRFISTIIQTLLDRLVNKMGEVAKGNLNVDKFGYISKSDVGVLCASFDVMLDNLAGLVKSVKKSVEDISASSQEMAASAEQTAQGSQQASISTTQLAQGAQEISTNVGDGASNIGNMNKIIQVISKEATEIAGLGNSTEQNAVEGSKNVQNAIVKIDSIKTVSEDISDTVSNLGSLSSEIETIVDLIKNIASQTNLLALNAAIEAARAGEHGKGFAVVAEEVKKLAGESAEATDKITSMIKEIQSETSIAVNKMDKATKEVEEGVSVVNEAGNTLENIIAQVKQANVKIQHVTNEIEKVASDSDNLVRMIENISAITEETAASAEEISSISEEQTASIEEISASSQTLAHIAEDLNKQVSVFKI